MASRSRVESPRASRSSQTSWRGSPRAPMWPMSSLSRVRACSSGWRRRLPCSAARCSRREQGGAEVTTTGAMLKERLLALDDGDNLLVGSEQWVSLGGHGFEVTDDFGAGDMRMVARADRNEHFDDG